LSVALQSMLDARLSFPRRRGWLHE
jgi:hypothetical protein